MNKKTVKDLMIPLEEYPTVPEDAKVIDAVIALEKAQETFNRNPHKHRAVLVHDSRGKIIGKISQWDLIRSLEPKYEELGDMNALALSGVSPLIIKSMMESIRLWQDDFDLLCRRVAGKKVRDIMYRPTVGEKVEENATIGEALHALVVGHHQSLLVTRGDEIVGILRLIDVFKLVCEKIKSCGKQEE